uniref:ribose-5-phosphate isomerase n=1 Tax=Oryza punctata TaxID=4537 RepID=A0A0E0KNV4_ORYPU
MGSFASPLDATPAPPSAKPSPPPAANGAVTQEELKRVAAHRAVEMVESGMTLGLGTGSTAAHALDRLGELLRSGELTGVAGVPTSLKTEAHAARVGIPMLSLGEAAAVGGGIDLSIDGADEVDPELNLVKGRGGSLLREKMIEGSGGRFVVIVDESKLVPRLGCTGAVPVEVVPFGCDHTLGLVRKVFDGLPGFTARLRTVVSKDGEGKEKKEVPFVTDNGNYIVEMFFEDGIRGDLNEISDRLLRITGVVEHGMFLGMATSVVVAKKDGTVALLHKKK